MEQAWQRDFDFIAVPFQFAEEAPENNHFPNISFSNKIDL